MTPRFRLTPLNPIALPLLLLAATAAVHAQSWSPTADVGFVTNNNVSNSVRQEQYDQALTAALDLTHTRLLNRDWQGSVTLGADTTYWTEFTGLNLSQLSADLGLRRKFGLGPYAPKLDLHVTGFHQLADVEEWSGHGYHATASLQKRFTPQLSTSLAGDLKRLDAHRSVFSGTVTTATAAVTYDLTPDWRLHGSLRYAEGTQLSWCRESFPEFSGKGPQWKDGIFGGDWFPYRAEGHLRAAHLSISRALGAHSAVAASYDASESRATSHLYRNQIFSLNFTHAF